MTKPQELKRYNLHVAKTSIHHDAVFSLAPNPEGTYMLAEEALAYAEAVRNEALEWCMNRLSEVEVQNRKAKQETGAFTERAVYHAVAEALGDVGIEIRDKLDSLKREGK